MNCFDQADLSEHMESHKLECIHCKRVQINKTDLESHQNSCKMLPKGPESPITVEVSDNSNTEKNENQLSTSGAAKIDETNKALGSLDETEFFRGNLTNGKESISEVLQCNNCDYTTSQKKELDAHVSDNHTFLIHFLQCNLCNFVSPLQIEMDIHILKEHNAENEKNDNNITPPAQDRVKKYMPEGNS